MKLDKNYIQIRIDKLKAKPVENAKLIKKWERLMRRACKEDN